MTFGKRRRSAASWTPSARCWRRRWTARRPNRRARSSRSVAAKSEPRRSSSSPSSASSSCFGSGSWRTGSRRPSRPAWNQTSRRWRDGVTMPFLVGLVVGRERPGAEEGARRPRPRAAQSHAPARGHAFVPEQGQPSGPEEAHRGQRPGAGGLRSRGRLESCARRRQGALLEHDAAWSFFDSVFDLW